MRKMTIKQYNVIRKAFRNARREVDQGTGVVGLLRKQLKELGYPHLKKAISELRILESALIKATKKFGDAIKATWDSLPQEVRDGFGEAE